MKNHLQPPAILESYKASVLRTKMAYVHALLKWVAAYLGEVQDMEGGAAFDGLAHAKKIRRTAWGIEKTFEEAAIAEMFHAGTPIHEGDGYTAVMRPGQDRKGWKHPNVMQALIESTYQRMAERFPYVPEGILRAIVTESMWQVHKTGRIEWRSTDLRRAGIDPDAYSTKTPESPTIDLRGPASYADTPSTRRRSGVGRSAAFED